MTTQTTTQLTRCRCICPNGCTCGCTCPAATELRTLAKARRDANGGPIRIQRRRTHGWRAPKNSTYVGRPTRFGNPFRLIKAPHGGYVVVHSGSGAGVGTFATAVDARRYATDGYRVWIQQPDQEELRRLVPQLLYGRDLTCWCPLPAEGEPDHCHAAVLLELANSPAV